MTWQRIVAAFGAAGVMGSCVESPTEVARYGSIAPRIALVRADSTTRASLVLPLTAVRAQVIGPVSRVVDLTLNGGSWTGRATGLEPGTYEVIIEGIANGEVQYYGRLGNVAVARGAAAEPFVQFAPSIPAVAAPPLATTTSFAQRITFARVAAASGYTVQASPVETFASGVIQTTATDTAPVVSVTDRGTWYVRTRASLPQTGSPVPWSAARSWTVETATGGATAAAAIAVPSALTTPQTVSGRNLTGEKRVDWFSIGGVRAGDSLIVETFAARLELTSPLNTILTVFRADGTTEVGSNGDATGTTDSRVAIVAEASETYLVRVTPDANGNGHFELRVAQRRLPAPPTGLTATLATATRATLAWTDASDNENSFQLERCTGSDCTTFTEIGSVPAGVVTYSDTTLVAGTTYRYRVRSRNDVGNSAYSNIASISSAVPSAPSNLTANPISGTLVRLSWTDNANNETGVRIERCTGASCEGFTELRDINTANVTTFDDSTTSVNTTYRYRVRMVNAIGLSTYSNIASVSSSLPAAPTGLTATLASTTRAILTWTDVATNETGYEVLRCSTSALCVDFTRTAQLPAGATSFTDSTLTAGQTFRWQVRAVNVFGASASSDVASVSTTVPAGPTGLTATLQTGNTVRLQWTPAGSPVLVERCQGAACDSFARIDSVAGTNLTTYDDASTKPAETAYSYRVRFSNIFGASAASNVVSVTTPAAVLAAPTGLTAVTQTTSRIDLSWTDAVTGESGFQIQRCSDNACATVTRTDTVAANATTFSSTGLSASTTYHYRVRAIRTTGDPSAFTSVVTANTTQLQRPSSLSASNTLSTSTQLTWTAVTGATGYRIQRCEGNTSFCNNDANFTVSVDVTAPTVTLSVTGLTANRRYEFRVFTLNGNLLSADSRETTVNTPN